METWQVDEAPTLPRHSPPVRSAAAEQEANACHPHTAFPFQSSPSVRDVSRRKSRAAACPH